MASFDQIQHINRFIKWKTPKQRWPFVTVVASLQWQQPEWRRQDKIRSDLAIFQPAVVLSLTGTCRQPPPASQRRNEGGKRGRAGRGRRLERQRRWLVIPARFDRRRGKADRVRDGDGGLAIEARRSSPPASQRWSGGSELWERERERDVSFERRTDKNLICMCFCLCLVCVNEHLINNNNKIKYNIYFFFNTFLKLG